MQLPASDDYLDWQMAIVNLDWRKALVSSSVMLSGEWATGGIMWIIDGSDTICLFGSIGSDPLENTTWHHFSKLSFQIIPIQTLNLISLVPETVSPAIHHPTPGLLSKHKSLIFSLVYRGPSGRRLISDQQNRLLRCCLGMYVVFQEIIPI